MKHYTELPFYWINHLSAFSRKELPRRFSSSGYKISTEEWALLLVLWSKGSATPSELSDETIKDRTTVTRLIDGMVRKDLVIRQENAEDRRRSDICLTPLGEGMKEKLVPIAMGLITQATSNVPAEDIETTIRTLRAFTQNLTSNEKQ